MPTSLTDEELIAKLGWLERYLIGDAQSKRNNNDHAILMACSRDVSAAIHRLQSQPQEEQWVSDRRPAKEDADDFGEVLWWAKKSGAMTAKWNFDGPNWIHWRKLPPPPTPREPSEEERVRAEDEAAWKAEYRRPSHAMDVDSAIKDAFFAGRQSQREGGSK